MSVALPTLEELPEAARPDPSCALCRGSGIRARPDQERAVADACGCIPDCHRCGGSGRVTVRVDAGVQVGRCQCRRVPDRLSLFNHAAIPGRYAHADLVGSSSGFLQAEPNPGDAGKSAAFTSVMSWIKDFHPGRENRGFVLHGPVGTGKTHLLIAVLRDLALSRGVRVRFIEFSRLLSTLREGFESGRSGAGVMAQLVEVPVLGIDEIGKGRMTDWELSVIDELVSRRYNAMACTLGTSNFKPGAYTAAQAPVGAGSITPQTLGDRVGDRVYSRLKEMCDFVEVGGADFRKTNSRA